MPERVIEVLGPSTGGIRRHVEALVSHLLEAGWEVATAGPPGVVDPQGRWVHHDLQVATGPADLLRLPALRRRLGEVAAGADLVHAHGLKAGWSAVVGGVEQPIVATVHNLVLDEAAGAVAPALRWLEGRLPARVDHVIAVSEEISRRFTGRDNVTVIPPAGPRPVPTEPPSAVRSRLGVPNGAPLVVTVSRLHPQKDLPTALRALGRLRAPAHLAIVGTGPDEAVLRTLAVRLGVADRVHFVGQRPNPADEIAAADVVLVSSLWESGPLALLEAMQLGRPVVTTPVGLATTLVEDGITGRVVGVGDDEAMADALDDLLAAPDDAARLAGSGQAAVLAAFGPAELAGRVESVYREVLAQ